MSLANRKVSFLTLEFGAIDITKVDHLSTFITFRSSLRVDFIYRISARKPIVVLTTKFDVTGILDNSNVRRIYRKNAVYTYIYVYMTFFYRFLMIIFITVTMVSMKMIKNSVFRVFGSHIYMCIPIF